ncbi:MAG: 5'/3'-nucleotidase SurE [Dysgonamonadaceae bacterium]|nr:5'/3'-nucleotidase SurE [Dysgonamonadaceae bacterium]
MKPLILVTNDDGVQSPGIAALIKAVKPLGDVVVLAPDGPRSGMSSAITSHVPIRMKEERKEDGLLVYSCSGTPVDCVKLAINELLDRKPDLLVSGINHGSNAAICVLYSGTMGAALEGTIFGINAIGFSLTDQAADADFKDAAAYARIIAEKVLKTGLPSGVCLNVNIPNTTIKGIKVCTQTKGRWINEFFKSKASQEQDVYWLTGEFRNDEPNNADSDEWALANAYVSIVPTKIDLTAHGLLDEMQQKFSSLHLSSLPS